MAASDAGKKGATAQPCSPARLSSSLSTTPSWFASSRVQSAEFSPESVVSADPKRLPLTAADAPGDAKRGPEGVHRFGEIPKNVDVLLTHGAPHGIFDRMDVTSSHWGSSKSLRLAIEAKRPKAHFFGHIHEQRGMWLKGADGKYDGGVEYQAKAGKRWHSFQPPPSTYPCELVSCNAMKNHPELEGGVEHIAGPARLVLASRDAPGQPWRFSAEVVAPAQGGGGGGGKHAKKRKQGEY